MHSLATLTAEALFEEVEGAGSQGGQGVFEVPVEPGTQQRPHHAKDGAAEDEGSELVEALVGAQRVHDGLFEAAIEAEIPQEQLTGGLDTAVAGAQVLPVRVVLLRELEQAAAHGVVGQLTGSTLAQRGAEPHEALLVPGEERGFFGVEVAKERAPADPDLGGDPIDGEPIEAQLEGELDGDAGQRQAGVLFLEFAVHGGTVAGLTLSAKSLAVLLDTQCQNGQDAPMWDVEVSLERAILRTRWRCGGRMRKILPLLVFAVGCGKPPVAPQELDELTRYLYREWNNEDPEVLSAGLDNLVDFFADVDLDPDEHVLDRSWELTPIKRSDIHDVEWPHDRNPADTYGVSVARESIWPVEAHAAWQLEDDQLPAEPSAASYSREYPGMDDPSCFPDRSCDLLVTRNQVERQNLLMSLAYQLDKSIRWVELADGGYAMVARAYVAESTEGESGKSIIWQSYSMDVWLPKGKKSDRYQVLWSEADVAGASDAIQMGTVKSSTNDHFEATDEAIAGVR